MLRQKRTPEENEKAYTIMKRWGIPFGTLLLMFAWKSRPGLRLTAGELFVGRGNTRYFKPEVMQSFLQKALSPKITVGEILEYPGELDATPIPKSNLFYNGQQVGQVQYYHARLIPSQPTKITVSINHLNIPSDWKKKMKKIAGVEVYDRDEWENKVSWEYKFQNPSGANWTALISVEDPHRIV